MEETTVNEVTGVPPRVRARIPFRLVPIMVIRAPAPALCGAKLVIVGGEMKVNPANDAVPPGVVRLSAADEPVQTMSIIDVD
ncbi:MAG: hypothetical protein ACK53B_07035 [Bacteroidota bacterium]